MTTKTDKPTGTCPACFRRHRLTNKGTMVRHGWNNQGTRRNGEWGNVWHSAACFGYGRLPFEVSTAGTEAFLAKVIRPSLGYWENKAAELAARPDLTWRISPARYDRARNRNAKSIVRVLIPDAERVHMLGSEGTDKNEQWAYTRSIPSYEEELKRRIYKTEQEIEIHQAHIAELEKAVADWQPVAA